MKKMSMSSPELSSLAAVPFVWLLYVYTFTYIHTMHYDQSNDSRPSGSNYLRQASASQSPDPNRKRKRVSRACDACFTKKDRCDGAQPICRVCKDLNRRCTYNRPERKRGPLQGVRQRLEGQIEILEGILGYLVSTFPMIQQDALRMLRLDDGEAFMMDLSQRVDTSNIDPSTSSSSSRLPAGEIYPSFDKSYAKELWRHSDLAKSIAPSVGLRLGLQEEEEDVIEHPIHQQRVEEAKRARARLINMPSQLSRFSMQQQQYHQSNQNPPSTTSVQQSPQPHYHQMAPTIHENLKTASVSSQQPLVYPFNNNLPTQRGGMNTSVYEMKQNTSSFPPPPHHHHNNSNNNELIHPQLGGLSHHTHSKSNMSHLLSNNPQQQQQHHHHHHHQQQQHHHPSLDSQPQPYATIQNRSNSDQQSNVLPSLHSYSFVNNEIGNENVLANENGESMNLAGNSKSTVRNEQMINTIPDNSLLNPNLRINQQQNDVDLQKEVEGEVTQDDPFDAQWSHTSFDLADLGEGAHALAYALGLPSASYGDSNEDNVHPLHPLSAAMDVQMAASDSIAVLQQGFSV